MHLIPTLHRIHHLLMQPQTMKEGSQMSANVIVFFINLSSIHPEPKILFKRKKGPPWYSVQQGNLLAFSCVFILLC